MSRDRTPDEHIEDMMRKPRLDVEDQERRLYSLYHAAREEGIVVGIFAALMPRQNGQKECPFCLDPVADLLSHVVECDGAPEVALTGVERLNTANKGDSRG